MKKKLTTKGIENFAKENPNKGFDTCFRCGGVEPHMSMTELSTDSEELICDECKAIMVGNLSKLEKKFMDDKDKLELKYLERVLNITHGTGLNECGLKRLAELKEML